MSLCIKHLFKGKKAEDGWGTPTSKSRNYSRKFGSQKVLQSSNFPALPPIDVDVLLNDCW